MTTTQTQSVLTQPKHTLFGADLLWLDELRTKKWQAYENSGMPHRRLENWKYTDLSRLLAKHCFLPQVKGTEVQMPEQAAFGETYPLIFADGRLHNTDILDMLPEGVSIQSLSEAMKTTPEQLKTYFNEAIDTNKHPMVALNQALMSDGFVLRVEPGVILDKPLEVIYCQPEHADATSVHYHNHLQIGQDAQVKLIETVLSASTAPVLVNTVNAVELNQNAAFTVTQTQDTQTDTYHISAYHVWQQAHSLLTMHHAALNGVLGRYDVQCHLNEQGASCQLNGLYALSDSHHVDHHVYIDHAASDTRSDVYFKGVLNDKSRGVFNAKAVVQKGVENIHVKQGNHNLLLSKQAEIDTKPELEIYSEHLAACSHGATVGQIDEAALFYMQSRGIPEAQARHLLLEAFLVEPLEAVIDEQVQAQLKARLYDKLGQIL